MAETNNTHTTIEVKEETGRQRILKLVTQLWAITAVILALATALVFYADRNDLQRQLAGNDAESAAILNCGRRLQDTVDGPTTDITIGLVDLLVLFINVPAADQTRRDQITAKISDLEALSGQARNAVAMKRDWNAAGSPLPCPI